MARVGKKPRRRMFHPRPSIKQPHSSTLQNYYYTDGGSTDGNTTTYLSDCSPLSRRGSGAGTQQDTPSAERLFPLTSAVSVSQADKRRTPTLSSFWAKKNRELKEGSPLPGLPAVQRKEKRDWCLKVREGFVFGQTSQGPISFSFWEIVEAGLGNSKWAKGLKEKS